jgi:predicted ATPase
VAQLVRRLDGLPLAIELAADQLTTMTLEELAGRLAAGSVWLATDRHGRTPRNRSLLASVAWSYEQLAGPARRLLCRLSIFPGTFSVADATAICSGPPLDALGLPRLLTDLVTGSLVESAGTRYRLLAPVREFAQERLIGAGEAHVVALRYARHLARVPMQGIRREQRGPLAAVSA